MASNCENCGQESFGLHACLSSDLKVRVTELRSEVKVLKRKIKKAKKHL